MIVTMKRFSKECLVTNYWVYLLLIFVVMLAGLFIVFGLHRKPSFIANFEELEYARAQPFVAPHSVVDGLAIYQLGTGEPVLLFPYPHGHTTEPMAQSPIAKHVLNMGRMVVTFDAPGAYRSTRTAVGDMTEMIDCAEEILKRLQINSPIDVLGHSMGGTSRPRLCN